MFCAWADPSRFESARWLKTNSMGWRREKSHHGSEQRDQRASAARRRLCENCLCAILPQLERARGESASLRNLANAARVLEGNPALMNLRLRQSLSAAQSAGNTLVLGMPGGFVPLKNGPSTTAPEAPVDD
jgi:hypothetical protein